MSSLRTPQQDHLTIAPITISKAKKYIDKFHRHHDKPQGALFAVAVMDSTYLIRGVAIIGRPVARHLQDGYTVEVIRLATDECPNACSTLYAAAWRSAKDLGYQRIVTYILDDEPSTSLKAAGWLKTKDSPSGHRSCQSRPRDDHHPTRPKTRWEPAASRKTSQPQPRLILPKDPVKPSQLSLFDFEGIDRSS